MRSSPQSGHASQPGGSHLALSYPRSHSGLWKPDTCGEKAPESEILVGHMVQCGWPRDVHLQHLAEAAWPQHLFLQLLNI